MIKFIHCADIHLGSPMSAKLPSEKSAHRRAELRQTFKRMIGYAREVGARAILLCGDVFDSDRPLRADKEFFYECVKATPDIDFLYLRGNHDVSESYTDGTLENLKTFSSDGWTSFCYGDTVITGAELNADNAETLYSSLSLDGEKKNIVMLHGAVAEGSSDGCIDMRRLCDRGIDYLALGHYHSYRTMPLDRRGIAVYCGCLEGRGFDECGEKGFVTLDVGTCIEHAFVRFASRVIRELSVDIGECDGAYSAYEAVRRSCEWQSGDMLRVNLAGEISFDGEALAETVAEYLSGDCYFASVKDRTQRKIDICAFDADTSLRGEFVRAVLASGDYTEGEKLRIISYGLRALSGEEIAR